MSSCRLPGILAPAAETERFEAHRLEGDVARQNHKIGPGDFPAVFLLDRPQQPARLVEARVVRPAIEGREALLAGSGAAAPIADAVRACAVPGHPNEQPPVVAVVGRPPILRVRHQGMQVLDHGIQVEAFEFLSVVERLAHRIGQGGVLVENAEGSAGSATSRGSCVRGFRPLQGTCFRSSWCLRSCSAFFPFRIQIQGSSILGK